MSNAVATQPRPPVLTGAKVAALVPQSLEEAFRVSQAIAASGLAPKGIDKPEQILVAIMAGAELGLAPFQSLQSIAVINGRPSVWGDGLMAIVRSHGFKVKEWLEGEGDAAVAHAELTRPDNDEVTPRSFSVADAKRAGLWGKSGPWTQYPKRMLQMRARSWALRDGAADVLRGFSIREEVEDYQPVRDVTPQGTGMRARLEARAPVGGFDPDFVASEIDQAMDQRQIAHHAETGEIIEAEVSESPAEDANDFPGDKPSTARAASGEAAEPQPGADGGSLFDGPKQDPHDWAAEQNQLIEQAETVAALDALTSQPGAREMFEALQEKSPGMAKSLEAASRGRRKALADRERQG